VARKPPSEDGDAAASDAASARHDAILAAATTVFLRYGFKKTSMDDLARAAGLSRQGLYLHFDTKEALFKAAIVRLIAALRSAWRGVLEEEDASTEDRIVGAFETLHGMTLHEPGAAGHMQELLETARSLVGSAVEDLEPELITAVARLLTSSGVAASWVDVGVSAKELAENLWAASSGLKHTCTSAAAYRKGMRTAVKIVAARKTRK
jgi:AcrR family transcriptional regulator